MAQHKPTTPVDVTRKTPWKTEWRVCRSTEYADDREAKWTTCCLEHGNFVPTDAMRDAFNIGTAAPVAAWGAPGSPLRDGKEPEPAPAKPARTRRTTPTKK